MVGHADVKKQDDMFVLTWTPSLPGKYSTTLELDGAPVSGMLRVQWLVGVSDVS